MTLKKSHKIALVLLISPFLIGFSFILSMHVVAFLTGLPGFRGGPQDAFRHTLASAYVSRGLGGWSVDIFTQVTERNAKSCYDQMDWHNNNIGKIIGQSDVDIYETVLASVKNGKINASEIMVIRWLPETKWANFLGLE